jgi:putative colanic acid biosysnthesis UDP-glucose lipid carrier transferase
MQHRFSKYLPFLTFLGDICGLNGLFIYLYLNGHFIVHTYDRSWVFFLVIVNITWLLITLYTNPYRINRVYPLSKLVGTTLQSIFQHFLFTFTTIYLFDFVLVHKLGPIVAYVIFALVILSWRLSLYFFLSLYRTKGYNFRNVVIIGYGAIAKHLEVFFSLHPEYGYHFIGYFDDKSKGNSKILGEIASVSTVACPMFGMAK